MSLPRVLVTGATGFIGAHVVHQALEAGYPVRITSRPSKVDAMKKKYNGKVEIAAVADIASDDLTDALKGVDVVIHVAAGLPMKQDAQTMIKSGVDGALNVLNAVAAANIKKVIVTSSFVTMERFDDSSIFNKERVYNENDWNTTTKEELLTGDKGGFWAYTVVKTIAEREIWKFADEHPEIDITTLNPPYVYGPFAPGTEFVKGDTTAFSTDGIFFQNTLDNAKLDALQTTNGTQPPVIDVRDVAKAHILAISAPPATEVGRKRIPIAGPTFLWIDAVELLAKTRPQYKDRLSDVSAATRHATVTIDTTRAQKVLGLKEFIDWKDTVQDTADALMTVLQSWA